jgi:hypothetical protein
MPSRKRSAKRPTTRSSSAPLTLNVKGTYYGTQMADLAAKSRMHPRALRPSSWSHYGLGLGHRRQSTAIWFAQRLFREVRLIDYMESKD